MGILDTPNELKIGAPMKAPTANLSAPIQKPEDEYREFGDAIKTRQLIYDNVLNAAKQLKPLTNQRHTLVLRDVDYADPGMFTLKQQKEAILGGKTLGRRLVGTWDLVDNATQAVLDSRKTAVARVPFLTERGTFIHNGSEYTLANQMRLRPGIFTRLKDNGEVEAHANIIPGKGPSHRYFLDPASGVFYVKFQQAKIPLMPLIKALGAKDSQLQEAWGRDLWYANAKKDDPNNLNKILSKVVRKADLESPTENKYAAIREAMEKMEVDPEVSEATLGAPVKNLNLDALLATTKKLLAVSRGEADIDDRDHLAFQNILGPEDLFAERVAKDYGGIRRGLFYKTSFKNNLSAIQPNALTKQVEAAIMNSGLGQNLEEINNADVFDKQVRITRLGEGGIPSLDSVPDEARSVQPSHFGFADPVRTPESSRAGVDLFLSGATRKGKDGRIYSPFKDLKGNTVWKSPQDLSKMTIAFPKEMDSRNKRVGALQGGRIKYVPRDQVDLVMPDFSNAFSPLGNMIPMKSAVKAQRMAMASRMTTQALPLENAEAPLVRTGITGSQDDSYERLFGKHMGAISADKPGRVIAVDSDSMKVKYDDGTVEDKQLYNHFPYNRKTQISNTPMLKPGDTFGAGQLLAKSNYTDDKGVTALGKNLYAAYIPFKGLNFEDALVISESAAKKLSSQHMYQHGVDWTADHKKGKNAYVSLFASKFDKKVLDTIDDTGVVKPGTVVGYGHPLILAAKKKDIVYGKVHKKRQQTYSDASETWDHDEPGIVTDVFHGPKGTNVIVKTVSEMQVGDKLSGRYGDKGVISAVVPDHQMPHDKSGTPFDVLLNPLGIISRCYDEKTEFLTKRGWVFGRDITRDDLFACYDTGTGDVSFMEQKDKFHVAHYAGSMLHYRNKLLDFCVTPNHKMWTRCNHATGKWKATEARNLFKKKSYSLPVVGNVIVEGTDTDFVLPHVDYHVKDTASNRDEIIINAGDWAELLGWYLAEGNTDDKVHLAQSDVANAANCEKIASLLSRLPFAWHYSSKNTQFHITSKRLCAYLSQFGLCADKYIPEWLFQQTAATRGRFLEAYLAGDGAKDCTDRDHKYWSCNSNSKRLVSDLQRLLVYQGVSSAYVEAESADIWRLGIHDSSVKKYRNTSLDGWEEIAYDGNIYCPTVPTGYVVTRRNGKLLIAGNTNPAQMVEAALGKIAAKTGKPYNVADFDQIDDLTQFAIEELKKHNLSDLEDVTDPETGGRIPQVFTGNRFFMKLHHTAASKGQGRGTGGYSMDGTPAKGGESGSKRISVLDSNALLSHGATEVLRDAGAIRGQRNEEFWLPFMQGLPTPKPKVPFIYEKFVNDLKAAGINVVRDGTHINIMALTDKDIDTLAGDRLIEHGDTVHFEKGMKPVAGGLFDPTATGGNNGNRWAAIKLGEPMPNPVMEEPIRRLLGLTQKDFEEVIAGRKEFRGGTGTKAISQALKLMNVDKEIQVARELIKNGRATHRDAAIRRLGYLKAAKSTGLHPSDWMLTKAPVLPPMFRPVSVMSDSKLPLVSDINYLYKELIDANDNLKEMSKEVDDVGQERLNLYNSFKAVTGLGDPAHPKLQEKQVKGVLKHIFGNSPKFGTVQRKLISSTVDLVGRGVITPNPDLDMDSVGIPEDKAWDIYKVFITRRLRRRGMPMMQALQAVKDRSPVAKNELLAEMGERPVIINRAPVLHRFGIMAFFPKLTKEHTLQVSPLIVKGFNADFDGDAMQYHVPVDDAAKTEAIERMLPSRNLLSPADFNTPVHMPSQEYTGGLYTATTGNSGRRPKVFRNIKDVLAAFRRREIDITDPIEILS